MVTITKNTNNKSYRNSKGVVKYLNKYQTFRTSTILTPSSLFHKPTIISNNKTASGAIVFKLKYKSGERCIIIKISPNIYKGLHEMRMYDMMNCLVSRNITPCVIKRYKLSNRIFEKRNSHESIKTHVKFKTGILNLTETYDSNISELAYTRLHSAPEIFFEVIYTLECFSRMGFSHQDLHAANIFIIELKGLPNLYNKYIYTSRSGKKMTFYIPTSGQHVRIFDFDNSISTKANVHKSLQVEGLYAGIQNDIHTESYRHYYDKRDLMRFIFEFLYHHRGNSYKLAVDLFNMNNNSGVLRYTFPSHILNKCSPYHLDYDTFVHRVSKKPILISDTYMPSSDNMLMSKFFKHLTVLPKGGKVYSTFNINNIM